MITATGVQEHAFENNEGPLFASQWQSESGPMTAGRLGMNESNKQRFGRSSSVSKSPRKRHVKKTATPERIHRKLNSPGPDPRSRRGAGRRGSMACSLSHRLLHDGRKGGQPTLTQQPTASSSNHHGTLISHSFKGRRVPPFSSHRSKGDTTHIHAIHRFTGVGSQ